MPSKVLILGAGAAGCMAAIHAARRGCAVVLADHGKRVGGKIPISGGGRCNFTNTQAHWSRFFSANPRFAASALAAFPPSAIIAMLDRHAIAWHEKHQGQLFCDGSATQVVAMLEKELKQAGVEARLGRAAAFQGVEKTPAGFRVSLDLDTLEVDALVVATGGLSYPVLGATDVGYRIARQFGHAVVETAPALDGFVFGPQDAARWQGLAGVSLPAATLSCGGKAFTDGLLFTHRGLSGPAALQASLYWKPGAVVHVNLWGGAGLEEALLEKKKSAPSATAPALLETRLPRRLARACAAQAGLEKEPLSRVSAQDLRRLAGQVSRWEFRPVSGTGYHKAEVTRGGVDTAQLEQKTMQSRLVPGLYFIGEVVDITGQLGGYNFQWAWASGFQAGNALS